MTKNGKLLYCKTLIFGRVYHVSSTKASNLYDNIIDMRCISDARHLKESFQKHFNS